MARSQLYAPRARVPYPAPPPRGVTPPLNTLPRYEPPPAPKASPTRRMTAAQIDDWLLDRLEAVWPGASEALWRGKISGFAQSNDYLFVCNDRAVLLMMVVRQAMTGAPSIFEVLAWSRDSEDGWISEIVTAQPLTALYRHALEWLRAMKGERMIVGICSDMRAEMLAMELGGAKLVEVR